MGSHSDHADWMMLRVMRADATCGCKWVNSHTAVDSVIYCVWFYSHATCQMRKSNLSSDLKHIHPILKHMLNFSRQIKTARLYRSESNMQPVCTKPQDTYESNKKESSCLLSRVIVYIHLMLVLLFQWVSSRLATLTAKQFRKMCVISLTTLNCCNIQKHYKVTVIGRCAAGFVHSPLPVDVLVDSI